MKAEVFKEGKSFAEIIEFFKEKGFIEKSSDYIPDYLEDKAHSYFEISEDGTLLIIIEYSSEDKISDFEKELKNVFTEYMILVKNDLSEYRFYKYDPGTDKTLKLRKKRSDLEAVFLKKLESIEYNNLESIEALFDRREFIKEFYQLYCDTEGYLFRKIEGIPDDHDRELFTKIILQRMMFLWFLQKKKLLDNNENYFVEKYNHFFKSKMNFYNGFLKNLFFQGLCVKPGERSKEINDLIGDVPYLNGGLFIESEIERKYNDSIRVPNEAFYRAIEYPIGRGERNIPILNLLECKEWTVDERSGDVDKLNPEILGYIFEKSINKKDLGAVYTPEEITTYICKNTIHPYLLDRVNEEFSTEYKDLDAIFKEGNKDQWRYLFEVLGEIKIVDPAVGSGHFLVDAIVILERIYHKLRDKEIIGWSNYQIREQIIINNLFGVDILEGAVEICKLRLFLALAETFRTKEDVQPLPNIDFNIRCGNSLIGFVSTDELIQKFFSQGDTVNALARNMRFLERHAPEVAEKAREIISRFDIHPMDLFRLRIELVKRYRVLHDKELQPEMRRVLQDITNAFNRELNAQYYGKIQDIFKRDKNIKQLSENERYQKYIELQPFHWVMEYSEVVDNGGFDVVIGNPPYGPKILSNIEKEISKNYFYQTTITNEGTKGSTNGYSVFIERSYYLLLDGGAFGFIVPNTLARVDEYSKVRRLLSENVFLYEISDDGNPFVGPNVHQLANTLTVLYKKIKTDNNFNVKVFNRKEKRISYVPIRIFRDYGFFMLYYDDIFDFINKLNNLFFVKYCSQGKPRRADVSINKRRETDVQCIPAQAIHRYKIINKDTRFVSINYVNKNKLNIQKDNTFIILPNYTRPPMIRATIKPVGYIPDGTSAFIYDNNLSSVGLLSLLNSRLVTYLYVKYILNKDVVDMNLSSNLKKLSFVNPNKKYLNLFNHFSQYLLVNLNDYIDKLNDYLVYELYFSEKFKQDGMPTYLAELVEPYLFDIDKIKLEKDKLKKIEEFANKIKKDKKIQKEIEKIKSHPWVKIIEEGA